VKITCFSYGSLQYLFFRITKYVGYKLVDNLEISSYLTNLFVLILALEPLMGSWQFRKSKLQSILTKSVSWKKKWKG